MGKIVIAGGKKMSKQKTEEEVRAYVERVAEHRGWKLHPNDYGTLDLLVEGLKNNYNRLGYFNCPCRDTNDDRNLDRDIICPCDYAKEDIAEFGRCYCALFFDPEYDFSTVDEIGMIPDRRPQKKYN